MRLNENDMLMLELQYDQLLDLMELVSGHAREDLTSRSRKVPLPVCRYLIARELTDRGYSISSVSAVMGLNHATVISGFKLLDYLQGKEKDIRDGFRWALDIVCPNFE